MKATLITAILLSFINYQTLSQDNCLDFDGINDQVRMPLQNLTGNSELTIEAWVNPDDLTTNSLYSIVRQNAVGLPAYWLLAFQANGSILSFGINTRNFI